MRAGDFNGDGYDDFVAADGSNTYVFPGGSSGLSTTASTTIGDLAIDHAVGPSPVFLLGSLLLLLARRPRISDPPLG